MAVKLDLNAIARQDPELGRLLRLAFPPPPSTRHYVHRTGRASVACSCGESCRKARRYEAALARIATKATR